MNSQPEPTSPLTLETKTQPDKTPIFGNTSGAGLVLTPAINEDYWQYRVMLSDRQGIVGFPKFFTIGIGFMDEKAGGPGGWNTNFPYTCGTEEIYEHIAKNKGDNSISREDCLTAIKMVQDAAAADRRAVR
jgi:hypothetical protein